MADRPLLILPTPGDRPPGERHGGGGNLRFPERTKQARRLEPQLTALQEALDKRRASLQVSDPSVVPEEVVVFDLRGTVDDFLRAVKKYPDFEWLAEVEVDDVEPGDDFYTENKDGDKRHDALVTRRLFMVFVNQKAQNELIRLFRKFRRNETLPSGAAPWKHVFRQLKAVRTWNATDRLHESGLTEALEEEERRNGQMVSCELELWFRETPEKRTEVEARVRGLVSDHEGETVSSCVIPEIRYHALAVRLPVSRIRDLVPSYSGDLALAECEQLQYLRAAGQMSVAVADADTEPLRYSPSPDEVPPRETPVMALFDGLPLGQHEQIREYLVIDDPDDYGNSYPPARRRHGTAMASLVVRGDLGAPGMPVSRRVYHRPIFQPDLGDPAGQAECLPSGTLPADLLLRAVRRMLVGESARSPSAPSVAVVGLALGLRNRPFGRTLSPLARLLDWLSWEHKILFVVSAGNHTDFPGPAPPGFTGAVRKFENKRRALLEALAAATSGRRLLSPAESVNALTVGAEHADESSNEAPPRWSLVDLASDLPSPISAHGLGFRRSVKPDLLLSGGRVATKETVPGSKVRTIYEGPFAPGQLAAAPGSQPGVLNSKVHVRGTSGATALAVREAAFLHDLLDDLRGEPGGQVINAVPRSIWIKTLLAHAADWGAARGVLREVLTGTSQEDKWREFACRMIGYGTVKIDRVNHCTPHRVIALGGGELRGRQSHIHRFPLPSIATSKGALKKLTVTLSWMTPVNPKHQAWRRAQLWFDIAKQKITRKQADWQAAGRGTVQHEVWEGVAAIAASQGVLELQVNCREDAGTFEDSVPYALAVSLEIAQNLGIDIFDEVRAAVEAMRVTVPVGN